MSCPPTGSPFTRPMGRDMAGTPVRFAGRGEGVREVHRHRVLGPLPRLERGGRRVVGVKMRSTPAVEDVAEVLREERAASAAPCL